jgi:hypothetical protein
MKERIMFTCFTLTSCKREVAELYDGNIILIIDLRDGENDVSCGANISSISELPDEEEFLIWPGKYFNLVEYDYEKEKNKHIIYLETSDIQIFN